MRSKKKNDVSLQKYAAYLCNLHLSESKGQKWVGRYNKRAVSANWVRIYYQIGMIGEVSLDTSCCAESVFEWVKGTIIP